MRFLMELPIDMGKEDIEKAVLESEQAQKWTEGKTIKKVIVVPTPSSEFTEMVPSCASTMRRQMINPSPVPLSPLVE